MAMTKPPDKPTLATLEVVVMPNGEILCLGKTVGWIKQLGKFLKVKRHYHVVLFIKELTQSKKRWRELKRQVLAGLKGADRG